MSLSQFSVGKGSLEEKEKSKRSASGKGVLEKILGHLATSAASNPIQKLLDHCPLPGVPAFKELTPLGQGILRLEGASVHLPLQALICLFMGPTWQVWFVYKAVSTL